jgi:hypothetical protein
MPRLALFFCLLAIIPSAVHGETYFVDPDGTGDFPTIQAAIDFAQDGDIVELSGGVFTGDGNRDISFLGKAIAVRSQGGDPHNCVIDCDGSPSDAHRGFIFENLESPEAILDGVTITNGYHGNGGGIFLYVSSPTIRDCVLLRNTGFLGGGMDCDQLSEPALIRCTFAENSATYGGGMCI